MLNVFRCTRMCTVACAAVLLAVAPFRSARAVVNGAVVPDSETRFDAVGLFLTVPTVGTGCGGYVSGTCTLIGPDIVILARHSVVGPGLPLPLPGTLTHRVRFRRGVDGRVTNHSTGDCTAPFQEIAVAEFIASPQIGVDVVLARLATPALGIVPIPADPTVALTGNREITLAGWGYDGLCFQTGDAWALRTRTALLPSNPHASSCCFDYNAAASVGGCYSAAAANQWAIGNLHDSGAPILFTVVVDGRPELRVGGIVRAVSSAIPVSMWNDAGGQPALPLPAPVGPGPCSGDFNGDGRITVQDLFDFIAAYFGQLPGADVNHSGLLSVQDLFDYMRKYFNGC